MKQIILKLWLTFHLFVYVNSEQRKKIYELNIPQPGELGTGYDDGSLTSSDHITTVHNVNRTLDNEHEEVSPVNDYGEEYQSDLEAEDSYTDMDQLDSGSFEDDVLRYFSEDADSSAREVFDFLSSINRQRSLVGRCTVYGTVCNCSNLGLTEVPDNLPVTITTLLLYNNSLATLVNNTFTRYPRLTNLVLSKNQIKKMELGCFNGLEKLLHLNLRFCNLSMSPGSFKTGVFSPLKSLRILILNKNAKDSDVVKEYPDQALADLKNLEALFIDGLKNKTFGLGFLNMTRLRNLTLAGFTQGFCKLQGLTQETFVNLAQIVSLNISDCSMQGQFMSSLTFASLPNLQVLDLSYNPQLNLIHFQEIACGFRNSNLTHLYVNAIEGRFNEGVKITSNMVKCLPKSLKSIEARTNGFYYIDVGVFETLPETIESIDVSDNRFVFGKYLENLVQLKNLRVLKLNGGTFVYNLPRNYPKDQQRDYVSRNSSEYLVLPLPPKLKHLEMNIASLNYVMSKFQINASNSLENLFLNLNYFPRLKGPVTGLSHIKKFMLRDCSIETIDAKFFNNFPTLETLDLGYNELKSYFITENRKIFKSLHMLKTLDITNNRITRFDFDIFYGLFSLKNLLLNNNELDQFNISIDNMFNLSVLNLSYNQLGRLPDRLRKQIDLRNVSIDLADNPIRCDCKNLDFLKWMAKSKAFDKSFYNYFCVYADGSIKAVTDGYEREIQVLIAECAHNYTLFLAVLGATLLVIVVVVSAVVYRYRWKIRYMYYAAYLRFSNRNSPASSKAFVYDVFISYSSEDDTFVTEEVVTELRKRNLKLHVHGRDFVAGAYIASNILTAVKESRRTLVVLTRNLLGSKWCDYELQMANMEAVDTGRPVLVFLLKDAISNREMGSDLLNHIRNNTYIQYPTNSSGQDGDAMTVFWDKLAHDLKY
ncbi:toll-like receptor 4 [Physella acuta]|uniref:toll-like receptor 4 n=1 Tax=Physella acuta TaxID=109671 RepID=UPI0027DE823C|nr:toll-like receptor 4 [Physella acuta]